MLQTFPFVSNWQKERHDVPKTEANKHISEHPQPSKPSNRRSPPPEHRKRRRRASRPPFSVSIRKTVKR
ncbi:hypothetical protein HanXRQr2_Chr11g0493121 [Helianthus annuus]|uniref:Uncharacterized protein n=1 Tax=Helianthus annuus TaxID=4232 RepID=A0A9K3HQ92_HELAN|nr:hypothetical protein HanXRQr2_Chr11g0493121 [Helianthus annuus]KAJ0875343.1 hypothetical protein HanPSC8_Chr11g0475161 [Helianthus annuus]